MPIDDYDAMGMTHRKDPPSLGVTFDSTHQMAEKVRKDTQAAMLRRKYRIAWTALMRISQNDPNPQKVAQEALQDAIDADLNP